MKNKYYQKPLANIYAKPNVKSEITSQILYGEEFKVLKRKKDWIKIKTNFDNYIGYIKKNKFNQSFKPTHKIYKLKSKIFKRINGKFLSTKDFLPFASGISFKSKKNNSFPRYIVVTISLAILEYIISNYFRDLFSLNVLAFLMAGLFIFLLRFILNRKYVF